MGRRILAVDDEADVTRLIRHSRRLANVTVGVARELGLTGSALTQIEHGALLHDIGKLRIPDNILVHAGELNSPQWEIMRKHPEYGYEFLSRIGILQGAATYVLCHHEKYDGSGYPRGLKGEAIPLEARIFSLVDAIDAMIYDRPYHAGISFHDAREEVYRCAGTHFDPNLIEPVLRYLARNLPQRTIATQKEESSMN